MTKRKPEQPLDPVVRIQRAVDELDDAFRDLDNNDDQIRALAPYLDADTLDTVAAGLSVVADVHADALAETMGRIDANRKRQP